MLTSVFSVYSLDRGEQQPAAQLPDLQVCCFPGPALSDERLTAELKPAIQSLLC